MTEPLPRVSVELTLKDSATGREVRVDDNDVVVTIVHARAAVVEVTVEADFLGAFRAPATPLPTMIDGGGLIAGGK